MDISQLARSIVERATGESLTPKPLSGAKDKGNNYSSKHMRHQRRRRDE